MESPRAAHLDGEAGEGEAGRRRQLETRVRPHQHHELLRQLQVVPDEAAQAFRPVRPQHEPELQRPEAPPQRQLPVLEEDMNGFAGLGLGL